MVIKANCDLNRTSLYMPDLDRGGAFRVSCLVEGRGRSSGVQLWNEGDGEDASDPMKED